VTTKTAWFAPFVHPTPARLEAWSEREAAEGWQPHELDDMSAIRLRLTKARGARVRYVVDPQQRPDADYRSTYEDAGWEYVGELSSLHVWRRRYKGERPEAFTDSSSRKARDMRLARVTGTLAALVLAGAAVRLCLGLAGIGGSAEDWPIEAGVLALIGVPLAAVTVLLARHRKP
jgi:hypothetical protein